MKEYRFTITGDRYPTDYVVSASSWPTAVARAVRQWQKKFKGSRTESLRITGVKIIPNKTK